eukprot:CAMPEP_0184707956 /NCGR_PEP_ID=MMETSP0313-20130426/37515_1 /TAXON_ID=2792 /ORGANISM="Porphyridium aerugineum, Strain SAG 1380-2" /LENGTH=381 /DNA_ID=CAMNT_0027169537 /DNA_START=23 /DNA_END=1168 /DNA_ORIENTATION=+
MASRNSRSERESSSHDDTGSQFLAIAAIGGAVLGASIHALWKQAVYMHRMKKRESRKPLSDGGQEVLIAGIELGGTTSKAAVAWMSNPTKLVDSITVPTKEPAFTFGQLIQFIKEQQTKRSSPVGAVGIAAFGPLNLDKKSERFGCVTSSPKVLWQNFNLIAAVRKEFGDHVCIRLDTDVNAPALAELAYGSHHGAVETSPADCLAYITVGTGVGVGIVVENKPIHGLMHPEGGHIFVQRKAGDNYIPKCLYHKENVEIESMVSAGAIAERCGISPEKLADLTDDDPVWDFVAYYLAQLCIAITYLTSPHAIVLSGGVMKRQSLLPKIRAHFQELNADYVAPPKIVTRLDQYIVGPSFGYEIGVIGALHLGCQAYKEKYGL